MFSEGYEPLDTDHEDRQHDNRLRGLRMQTIELRAAALNQFEGALSNLRRLRQSDIARRPPPSPVRGLYCEIDDKEQH